MSDKKTNPKKPNHANACFLTTATVDALGLPDNCEPLELARQLRDEKMNSEKDQAAVALYYKVAPVIVERSTNEEWHAFWRDHMSKITALLKKGEHELAKELYTFATATLINQKAATYKDVELVNEVYDYGLKGIGKSWLPYSVRYALLKAAFFAGLSYQSVRLGFAKRKHAEVLDI
ncbi:hypothetical protein ACFOEK_19390 [Litoribrevibacter euphylliae]|uniref:Uncharacterized protein n=1 Tax=Litoribrevibacter euphylliae TaxID=1834034 RepID=A0ABV7HH52_9GAMM